MLVTITLVMDHYARKLDTQKVYQKAYSFILRRQCNLSDSAGCFDNDDEESPSVDRTVAKNNLWEPFGQHCAK